MKKLFLFASLIFFAFTIKAQELSFEETVKYINKKMNNPGATSLPDTMWAKQNGEIIIKDQRKLKDGSVEVAMDRGNLLELSGEVKMHSEYYKVIQESKGIVLYALLKDDFEEIDYYLIGLFISRTRDIRFSGSESKAEAERLYKAFIHLRSLCKKEKDPFDN